MNRSKPKPQHLDDFCGIPGSITSTDTVRLATANYTFTCKNGDGTLLPSLSLSSTAVRQLRAQQPHQAAPCPNRRQTKPHPPSQRAYQHQSTTAQLSTQSARAPQSKTRSSWPPPRAPSPSPPCRRHRSCHPCHRPWAQAQWSSRAPARLSSWVLV